MVYVGLSLICDFLGLEIGLKSIIIRDMLKGFSLVELSIVLVILGLLTGGILSGQSLIRAAELRSVTTEYSRYVAAVQSFRDRYQALSGDMRNAVNFWGAAHADANTCRSTQGAGTQTCNGDGNGRVSLDTTGLPAYERFRFWQHLANAGLIEGTYSGVEGASGISIIGTNIPASRLSGAGWAVYNLADYSGSSYTFVGSYDNTLVLGKPIATDHQLRGTVLKPEELWNVDIKLDDGRPGIGKVRAYIWNGCTTATASNQQLTAEYNLTNSSIACAFYGPQAF